MTNHIAISTRHVALRRFLLGVLGLLALFFASGLAVQTASAQALNISDMADANTTIKQGTSVLTKVIGSIAGGFMVFFIMKEIMRKDGEHEWGALGGKMVLILLLATVSWFVAKVFAAGGGAAVVQ